ncbi:MAG: TolC family protein [Candidatus Acidiferrales bacterium]
MNAGNQATWLCGAVAALWLALPAATGTSAQTPPAPVRITLEQALDLAVKHNHMLLALQTTIDQSRSQEITANLRPNPTIDGDAQFLPFFSPSAWSNSYIDNSAQFDLGIGYLFERGRKRQHRLEAARDQTDVTTSLVSDGERTLELQVAQQFVAVLLAESTLAFAQQDLASFQNTVDISEAQYKAGDIGEGDLLKIQLQLLQFQMDVSAGDVARTQALADLRQSVGFDAVPEDYDVSGELAFEPITAGLMDLEAMALRSRPDLRAAQQSVTEAKSQYTLAEANGKVDLSSTFNYTHISGLNTGSLFFNIQLPIFNRNQGEIARTRFAITDSEEQARAASDQVLTDVISSYAGVHTGDKIVKLYGSGYLKEAQDSRDISEYAYKRGAASLLDFLDAERSYRATELAYRQALASYMTALEQLRAAVGTRSLP